MDLGTVVTRGLRRMRLGWLGLLVMGLGVVACQPITAVLTPATQSTASITPVEPIEPVGAEGATRVEALTLADGAVISYTVVLPPNYAAGQPYPTLLALPPGSQTASMVEAGLDSYWQAGALTNGWVVVSPIAPQDELFFQGGERYLPAFLAAIAVRYPPEGGKFHLAGISNGGLSAFRIAGTHPELFHSLLVLPGYPPTPEDQANLPKLLDLPVAMYVGQNDTAWVRPMRETAATLNNQKGTVTLEIVPDEGHFIRSLIGGERLFAQLESFR